MLLCAVKETFPGETRIALTPTTAEKFLKLGLDVTIEDGLGEHLGYSNKSYETLGVSVEKDRTKLLSSADIILQVRKGEIEDIKNYKKKTIYIGFLDPFQETDTLQQLADSEATTLSLQLLPRTTLAQKMDALSSQANLAGYVAVILAASKIKKIFPMMTTPAGTIQPVKVFIIGAGVAGLQAIATAKRLGASVEAFDTRPIVEEQIQSLGAKFVKLDLGQTDQTKDGYAKALTEEQLQKQRDALAKVCSRNDIIITTAQVFGKKAPVIITKDMLKHLQPGTVLIDMAIETGGNIEGSKLNKIVQHGDVEIIGFSNLPANVALHASQMFASNLFHLILHFWDVKERKFNLNLEDPLLKACVITHNKQILNKSLFS